MIRTLFSVAVLSAQALSAFAAPDAPRTRDASRLSAQARSLVGSTRGLIVHVGCRDGALTAALRLDDACLVHGIDRDPAHVAKARAALRANGVYGSVSVETWSAPTLPYVDNTVNLLVVEDAGGVADAELLRVLVPGGTLRRREGAEWSKTIKPADAATDEWTHYRHDASGNAVAHDAVVGPPRHLQWTARPGQLRAHEFTTSLSSLVSSGGRIFYVIDEGPLPSVRKPSSWHLVARDAHNGLVIWKRRLPDWFSRLCGWTSVPRQLQRKLVADPARVYVTLGFHAPLQALDAATGETRVEYAETAGAEEVLQHAGKLVVVLRELTAERVASYRKLLELTEKPDTPLAMRDTAGPLISAFRKDENQADRSLAAFDAATGTPLWRTKGDARRIEALTLCAFEGRAFFQRGGGAAARRRGRAASEAVAIDLESGDVVWSVPVGSVRMVCEAGVVCWNKKTVQLLSRDDGSVLWSQPTKLVGVRDIVAAGGALWIGGFRPFDTGRRWTGPVWGPYFAMERDLATGEIRREVSTGNPKHHQRCYDGAATDRYLLTGRRGTEFIDLESGNVSYHSWARGSCRYGVMPANGLLYVPPHQCGCYAVAKLIGFNALAASRSYGDSEVLGGRLERGMAFGQAISASKTDSIARRDWPTFRRDAARSGSTPVVLPRRLGTRWKLAVGDALTAPTVAGGRVYVAAKIRDDVVALDLATGTRVWRYTTGGPVDSPPTLHAGLALVGCRDGFVYALRATDGTLAWRFRAARDPRRLVAAGRLESPQPVPGSVLVRDGVLWCTAGRSSFLDGGIDLLRLDPASGKMLSQQRIYSPDRDTGQQADPLQQRVIRGSRMDILSAEGERVFLQDRAFAAADGSPVEKRARHLFAITGFLDDEWVHRSYWVYGEIPATKLGSGGDRMQEVVFGRQLSVDGDVVYGYGRKVVHWSNEYQDGPVRFFARRKDVRKDVFVWERPATIRARALIVTGDEVIAAGLSNDASDGPAQLVRLSKVDGKQRAAMPIAAEPVVNGMAAVDGAIVLSLASGEVVCLAAKR